MGGPPLFNVGTRNRRGYHETKFVPELGIEPWTPDPRPSVLSFRSPLTKTEAKTYLFGRISLWIETMKTCIERSMIPMLIEKLFC